MSEKISNVICSNLIILFGSKRRDNRLLIVKKARINDYKLLNERGDIRKFYL